MFDELPVAAELLKTMRVARELKPEPAAAPSGRVFVIAPHSDDEAIGPGGTLLLSAAAGASITVCVLTDGLDGTAAVRGAESRRAAERLGGQLVLLGLADGDIAIDRASVDALAAAIEAAAPDVLMLPFFLDEHDDHRRACELLAAAAEKLTCAPEIWAYQVYGGVLANAIVDVTDVADAKRDLIRLFDSQAAARDWANFSLGLAAWNSRFLPRKGTAYGEMFLVLPFAEWLDLAKTRFVGRDVYRNPRYRGDPSGATPTSPPQVSTRTR